MLRHYFVTEWWSIVSLLGGLALPILWTNRVTLYFGVTCAIWGAVTLILVYAARWADIAPQSKESFIALLMTSQGTNYLYIGVGFVLWLVSAESGWRAAGAAVALQGFVSLVLETRLIRRVKRILSDSDGIR